MIIHINVVMVIGITINSLLQTFLDTMLQLLIWIVITFFLKYGTWTRNGITIVLKYDQSLGITDAILTIDGLSATTFSIVADGAFGGYHVLTSY